MNRHYYISNDLDDLREIETELVQAGIKTPQIHVYSRAEDSADVDARALHEVTDFTKSDVMHSGLRGLILGTAGAFGILLLAYLMGWAESAVGWMPFIFLAVIIFGFSTWEAGLKGIQEPNHEFTQFDAAISAGKHIFFLDVDNDQKSAVATVLAKHPQLEFAGDGAAAPGWLVNGQAQFQRFIKAMP